MNKNYHTHTYRCMHAIGTEEQYIKRAIKRGFKVLGFSDHSPWHYDSYHPTMRMEEYELKDYVNTLRDLKEKYKDQIEILIGLEAEYFEDKMDYLKQWIDEYQLDYVILGHHYDGSDETGIYYGYPGFKIDVVKRYVSQVLKAMDTGLFSYVAHPDVIGYDPSNEEHIKELEKINIKAKKLDMPLEFNLLGYYTHRHYPSDPFIDLCIKHQNKVILGIDAHEARQFDNDFSKVEDKLRSQGIEIVDTIKTFR